MQQNLDANRTMLIQLLDRGFANWRLKDIASDLIWNQHVAKSDPMQSSSVFFKAKSIQIWIDSVSRLRCVVLQLHRSSEMQWSTVINTCTPAVVTINEMASDVGDEHIWRCAFTCRHQIDVVSVLQCPYVLGQPKGREIYNLGQPARL